MSNVKTQQLIFELGTWLHFFLQSENKPPYAEQNPNQLLIWSQMVFYSTSLMQPERYLMKLIVT